MAKTLVATPDPDDEFEGFADLLADAADKVGAALAEFQRLSGVVSSTAPAVTININIDGADVVASIIAKVTRGLA
ncbi:MAG: hypothetical protein IT480_18545 [Gammaproteobacteria bacterium]|nr:hypothetical protein [Gammaproteobacteria bacterium]